MSLTEVHHPYLNVCDKERKRTKNNGKKNSHEPIYLANPLRKDYFENANISPGNILMFPLKIMLIIYDRS